MKKRNVKRYAEVAFLIASVLVLLLSFFLFDSSRPLSLFASVVGIFSLYFSAKGNPLGQALMLLFSLIYGYVSYTFSYYGEMITYLGMTFPLALISLISWLSHPFEKGKSQVAVRRVKRRELVWIFLLSVPVTALFYFLLKYFDTAFLSVSTLSVTTSFLAAALTWLRSPLFALFYAFNDVVLIMLWVYAARSDPSYLAMVLCFLLFLLWDLYGFLSWRIMERRQREGKSRTPMDA